MVFAIIYFGIYKNILTECKHAISTNDILTFNKTLENLSADIVEWTNIYESSYEDSIVNSFTWKIWLKITSVIEDNEGKTFDFSYTENGIYDDHIILMLSCWGRYSYFNNEILKLLTFLTLWMIRLIHQDHLDQKLGKNVWVITHI